MATKIVAAKAWERFHRVGQGVDEHVEIVSGGALSVAERVEARETRSTLFLRDCCRETTFQVADLFVFVLFPVVPSIVCLSV